MQLPLEPSPVCLVQGKVVPPASPTNGSSSGGGGGSYILFPGFLPVGTALGLPAAANVVGGVEDCEAACRRNSECNLFWFCEAEVLSHRPGAGEGRFHAEQEQGRGWEES